MFIVVSLSPAMLALTRKTEQMFVTSFAKKMHHNCNDLVLDVLS